MTDAPDPAKPAVPFHYRTLPTAPIHSCSDSPSHSDQSAALQSAPYLPRQPIRNGQRLTNPSLRFNSPTRLTMPRLACRTETLRTNPAYPITACQSLTRPVPTFTDVLHQACHANHYDPCHSSPKPFARAPSWKRRTPEPIPSTANTSVQTCEVLPERQQAFALSFPSLKAPLP